MGFHATSVSVATDDEPTIESALVSLRERSHSDAAFVIGLDGNMIDSANAGLPPATQLWDALDRGKEHGIIQIGDKLALAAASPKDCAPERAAAIWLFRRDRADL